ncbi:MAG: bifunctional nuclease family protein [Verrucomicrobiales bacterium]
MANPVIEVEIKAVLQTSGGFAIFIGNSTKVFVIYVDASVGLAIRLFWEGRRKERPLTHDLMVHLMTGLGARVDRVIINEMKAATYYARVIVTAENELIERKVIELDARPSDSIALACQQKAPIFVAQEVWDEVEDMSEVLEQMMTQDQEDEPHERLSEDEDED